MLSILLASVLSFAPQGGTVFTADGGRVRGTVLDDGAAGVTVQLADGSTRTVLRAQIVRIELADGTALRPARSEAPTPAPGTAAAPAPAEPAAPPAPVAVPIAPAAPVAPASTVAPAPAVVAPPAVAAAPVAVPPAPAAAAAPPIPAVAPVAPAPPAAAMPPAVPGVPVAPAPIGAAARASPLMIPPERLDTVHLARGGRVRCLVVEEGADGVVARLVDGTERRFAPGHVTRVDWADGTRSEILPAAAPAAP